MTDPADTTPDIPQDGPGDDVLAAEYALGLLDGAARRAFEARLRTEPVLVAAVRDWEQRFATLAEAEVEEVAPPPRLKAAVMAELFDKVEPRVSLWDRVAFWRGLSLASAGVAAVAVFLALTPPVAPPPTPVEGIPPGTILMSHLIPVEGSDLGLAVTREPDGALQVRRVAGGPTPGRAQEVWLLREGDPVPVSLGLLSDDPQTALIPPPEVAALFAAGATLAVSDEPAGGSPTGAPTGAILAAGTLVPL